jgi:hypothetical protein
MAITCNIDARGKKVRLINGLVTTAIGLVLVFAWAIPHPSLLSWMITACMLVGGGFMIFEGWAGWCVMRAMGFKTKI